LSSTYGYYGRMDLRVSNAGWGGSVRIQAAATGAYSWGTTATPDPALLVTRLPGAYPAQGVGVSGDTGVTLVEVHDVQLIPATSDPAKGGRWPSSHSKWSGASAARNVRASPSSAAVTTPCHRPGSPSTRFKASTTKGALTA